MRILLVKTSSLGDVVHNLPVVSDIRRVLPQAQIDWLVEEAFADIPRLHRAVGEVMPVAVRRWRRSLFSPATWREIARWREQLRQRRYDVVLDTQGLLKSALITAQAKLAAGGRRCGFDAESAREPLAARFYDQTCRVARGDHAVRRNRALAQAVFSLPAATPLDYGIERPRERPPWVPDTPYAVLLSGTSRVDKEWPESDWQALGTALAATGLRCVLPGGSPAERERAARLATALQRAAAPPPATLTELAALLGGAALVVGVDTGLVHLAAALDVPVLALFSASDPDLTGVLAGDKAVNLGRRGEPPSARAAVEVALKLLG